MHKVKCKEYSDRYLRTKAIISFLEEKLREIKSGATKDDVVKKIFCGFEANYKSKIL